MGASDSRALWLQLERWGPNIAAYVLSFTMLATFWPPRGWSFTPVATWSGRTVMKASPWFAVA